MDVENLEETGKAAKNLADRRFAAFKGDIQVLIDMGMGCSMRTTTSS